MALSTLGFQTGLGSAALKILGCGNASKGDSPYKRCLMDHIVPIGHSAILPPLGYPFQPPITYEQHHKFEPTQLGITFQKPEGERKPLPLIFGHTPFMPRASPHMTADGPQAVAVPWAP